MTDLRRRMIEEWPAVLAVTVLIVGHVLMTLVAEQELTPLGIPLLAAIAVFLIGELGRRLV